MTKIDKNGWPIWKSSEKIIQDAVLFIDNQTNHLSFHESIVSFHKMNNITIFFDKFSVLVEDLYYAPTT